MADYVLARKSRNIASNAAHVFLNILLGVLSVLITVFSGSSVLGILLVLLSKWRIFAVRKRYLWLNIKTNLGTVSNRIKFQQNKIGLSTTEVWLLVISIIFYILTILCLYLIFLRWKNSKSDIENKIASFQSEKLLENDD